MGTHHKHQRSWAGALLLGVLALNVLAGLAGCDSSSDAATPTASSRLAASPTVAPSATATLAPTLTQPVVPTATQRPTTAATSTSQPTARPTRTPMPAPTRLPPTPDLQALATEYPQLGAVLNNPAVSGIYKELLGAYQQGGMNAALAMATQRGLLSAQGDILATLSLSSEDTAGTVAQLQALGIKVLSTQGSQISIGVPAALIMQGAGGPGAILNQLTSMTNVIGVLPPIR